MSEPATTLHWDDFPDILTPKDLARLVQVRSPKTIRAWRRLKGILPAPCINNGRVVRWNKADVRECLERKMRIER